MLVPAQSFSANRFFFYYTPISMQKMCNIMHGYTSQIKRNSYLELLTEEQTGTIIKLFSQTKVVQKNT
jgi:Cys-tRNA synthase (O-phospho-L-seryl-tRNA:Cys-tRNA synthase)